MSENPIVVVCVDDEKIILNGLQHQLRHHFGDKIELELCESGQEVLEVFEEYNEERGFVPQVVISDQIMPRMKGDELFGELGKKYPGTVNILLTGQAEKHDVINAVNHGKLFRYIEKPWETEELVNILNQAIQYYKDEKRKTKALSEELGDLSLELEEINRKRLELEAQRDEFEQKQKEVEEAILYARKMQNEINLEDVLSSKLLKDYTIISQVVSQLSGDVLWLDHENEKLFAVLVDYQEKGLNAASNALKIGGKINSIFRNKTLQIDELKMFARVLEATVPDVSIDADKIKLSIVQLNLKTKELQFIGVRSSIIIHNGIDTEYIKGRFSSLQELKNLTEERICFKNKVSKLYLFSDGVIDQYGGEAYERYGIQRLMEKIEKYHADGLKNQKAVFEASFNDWRGDTPLLDDLKLLILDF